MEGARRSKEYDIVEMASEVGKIACGLPSLGFIMVEKWYSECRRFSHLVELSEED